MVQSVSASPRFAGSSLWATVQGRVVYVEGCVTAESQVRDLEAWARSIPNVQQAIAIVRSNPAARVPYRVMPTQEGLLPTAGFGCALSLANLALEGRFDQLATYFRSPARLLTTAEQQEITEQLRRTVSRLEVAGGAQSAMTPDAPAHPRDSVRIRVGYPVGNVETRFDKAFFAAESKSVAGLLLSLELPPGGSECALYAISFETSDLVGMQRIRTLLAR